MNKRDKMNSCKIYCLILLCLIGMMACDRNEELGGRFTYEDGVGGLDLSTAVAEQQTVSIITKAADFSGIDAKNFYVAIKNQETGELVKEFSSFSAMEDAGLPLLLPIGKYSVIASSFNLQNKETSEMPYFVDEQDFLIEEKMTTGVSLKCVYKSIGVELVLSERFAALLKEQPHNYAYEVEVDCAGVSYTFTQEKMPPVYFMESCEELVVKVRMRLGSSDSWYPTRVYRVKNGDKSPELNDYYIINLDVEKEPEDSDTGEGDDVPETISLYSKMIQMEN